MKNTLFLFACLALGLAFGFGVSTMTTYAQLDAATKSAETLQLSPIVSPARNLAPNSGGSCG